MLGSRLYPISTHACHKVLSSHPALRGSMHCTISMSSSSHHQLLPQGPPSEELPPEATGVTPQTPRQFCHVPSKANVPGSYDMELLWAAVHPTPLPNNIGARVEHFYLEGATGLASELIAAHMALPVEFIARLMWFGAVYSCPVVPAPPPNSVGTVNKETLTNILAWRTAGILRYGKDVSADRITGQESAPSPNKCE